MLHQKIVAMIKSLPKRLRRNLVPAADAAEKVVADLMPKFGQIPFMNAVCESMTRHAGVSITANDFQGEKQESHLQMLVTVIDDDGKTVAEGREVAPLRTLVGAPAASSMAESVDVGDESWARASMKSFDIDELPREVIRNRGGVQVAQYVGLVDTGDSAATSLFADLSSAEKGIRAGTSRLFAIAEHKELRGQVRWLPALEDAKIKLAATVSAGKIEDSLIQLMAKIAFVDGQPAIRTKQEFERRRSERGRRIAAATQDIAGWLSDFAEAYFSARRVLESMSSSRYPLIRSDIEQQMKWLLTENFLAITPWEWLKHYPRYFSAIAYRLDKVTTGAATRDSESVAVVQALWDRWIHSLSQSDQSAITQVDSEFRWTIEELRVSLFAQPLGTSIKVSPKRCEKLLT